MATRATIKIEGITFAKVYKHWDGYPEHMMAWLITFNQNFFENRGDDPEYKFAQLLRFTKKPTIEQDYKLDASDFTGWGVIEYNSDCGADYEYTLKADGTVSYEVLS